MDIAAVLGGMEVLRPKFHRVGELRRAKTDGKLANDAFAEEITFSPRSFFREGDFPESRRGGEQRDSTGPKRYPRCEWDFAAPGSRPSSSGKVEGRWAEERRR